MYQGSKYLIQDLKVLKRIQRESEQAGVVGTSGEPEEGANTGEGERAGEGEKYSLI